MNMVTVDADGRIALPEAVRERLDITPGTEVAIYEEDGKVIVDPEETPAQIIERMERLIRETSPAQGETTPLEGECDPIAQQHRDAVQRETRESGNE